MFSYSSANLQVSCVAAACIVAVLVAGADPASADISTPGTTGGEMIHGASELHTECYQHGTKIVDIGHLDGLNIGTVLRDSVLTLKRSGTDGSSVVIVPLDETVCVVTSAQ